MRFVTDGKHCIINAPTSIKLHNKLISQNLSKWLQQKLYEKSLKHLDISNNIMIDDGINYIFDGIGHNNSLKALTIKGSEYLHVLVNIGLHLQINPYLVSLHIEDIPLRDTVLDTFIHGLSVNKTLKSLSLINNDLSCDDWFVLGNSLLHSGLIYLEVGHNNIQDNTLWLMQLLDKFSDTTDSTDTTDMCKSKTHKPHKTYKIQLQSMYLHNNKLSRYGQHYLYEGLKVNTTLTSLTIDDGFDVGEVVYDNYTIKEIYPESSWTKSIVERNKRIDWFVVHAELLNYLLAITQLQVNSPGGMLPLYVMLEIFDWLPYMDKVNHYKKITLITRVVQTVRNFINNKKCI